MSNTVKLPTCPKCHAPIPAEAPQGLCPRCVLLGAATATEQGVPATATSEIPSLERIAKAFPQLEVLELIGRGGMGFVFKARQPHLDRFVALKLLPDKLAKDALFAERFNREGRVLARLNHPNIVSVYDFGQAGGFYYLAMEYVDGVNLRQAMRAGRFSPAEALALVPKVCEALQYAHEQGILHRDIKPENILLDTKGRVKIADFGIAKLVGEDQTSVTLTNTGAALGTPHYMAPEQFEKPATVDHRADIYSLGVVFYEMLTGELPIGRFAAPSSKTPVNSTVDDVVFRTLEKDRERRFQSAGEMKTQVEHLGEGTNAAPPQTDSTEAGQGKKRRISEWSIYGALAVGLSLPGPLTIIVALLGGRSVLTGRSGVGTSELWLTLGSVALPGLGGTLLGWLGLNEIRESRGRVRGLPLAMFATLFWPLTILGALTIGVPMFWVVPGGEPTIASTIGRFLVLLLPAAVIAFGFWTIHATARWAGQQQVVQPRGMLKWVFIVVLVVGMGVVLVTNPGQQREAFQPPQPPQPIVDVERWSPEFTPGEKPRPSEILQEAHRFTGEGRYEEALQRHIWFHNHALEFEPSQSAVRLSFAISYWAELGRRYPKAKDVLVDIRDRNTQKFEEGGGYFELFQEVAAINRELNQQAATLALFKSIEKQDTSLAKRCYFAVDNLLVERGEYELCARSIGDFQQRFEQNRYIRTRFSSTANRTPEANRSQLDKEVNSTFINQSRTLVEILVGIGRKAEAEEIRDQAVAVLDVPELRSALTDAEQKVANHSVAPRKP
jgi:tRNA A-37 threonylcarbamoyl transferase component Bud32